jgi:hypothetical protein
LINFRVLLYFIICEFVPYKTDYKIEETKIYEDVEDNDSNGDSETDSNESDSDEKLVSDVENN